MKINHALRYPFEDPDWPVKILFGAFFTFLSFFLIGVPVIYGYGVETLQRVRQDEHSPLPEWKDVGIKFIMGIKLIAALIVYYLPLLLAALPVGFALALTALTQSSIADAFSSALLFVVFFLVILPYIITIAALKPVIIIRFSQREQIRDALSLGMIFRQFAKVWQDAAIIVLLGVALSIASLIGAVVFIVGLFAAIFYTNLVIFHLYGQIARDLDEMGRKQYDA